MHFAGDHISIDINKIYKLNNHKVFLRAYLMYTRDTIFPIDYAYG